MLKQQKIDIKDTNMALFGTPLEREIKKHAAEGEPAWKNMKKQTEGIQVWRVEKFKIVEWPKEKYGQFHTGDSYIVLRTYKKEDKYLYDIHFWLGAHTSLDEAGTAAYKTVELDTYLDDLPVQYREVEGAESDKFLALFLSSYKVLPGGVESGFHHVEKEVFEPRLIHIKGKLGKTVARPVQVNINSLNQGDVFILDVGEKLYVFQPSGAGAGEKAAAAKLIADIKGSRGKASGPFTFSYDDSDDNAKFFWEFLGGKKPIKSAAEGGDDATVDKVKLKKRVLKVSDASGSLKVEEVNFALASLKTEDVFIVDALDHVYVWIGKGATPQERRSGVQIAQSYLNDQPERPKSTPIVRVGEGNVPEEFHAHFKNL